jgi:putative redox protein
MEIEVRPTEFLSDGETIRGHFVKPKGNGPFPSVCKFHGLPGGADQTSGVATQLAEVGFAVLTFDFRGFRSSEGMFSLAGEIVDGQNAITHLLESDFAKESWTGVVAASYGGAVAVCTAAIDSRVSAVCLRAPVYDTLWFAKSPMIPMAVENLLATNPECVHGLKDPDIRANVLERMVTDAEKHNPMNEIEKIAPRPLLIVHGSDDVGIDLAGIKRLYELAGEPKDLVVVEGADHELTETRASDIIMKTIVSWFESQRT